MHLHFFLFLFFYMIASCLSTMKWMENDYWNNAFRQWAPFYFIIEANKREYSWIRIRIWRCLHIFSLLLSDTIEKWSLEKPVSVFCLWILRDIMLENNAIRHDVKCDCTNISAPIAAYPKIRDHKLKKKKWTKWSDLNGWLEWTLDVVTHTVNRKFSPVIS